MNRPVLISGYARRFQYFCWNRHPAVVKSHPEIQDQYTDRKLSETKEGSIGNKYFKKHVHSSYRRVRKSVDMNPASARKNILLALGIALLFFLTGQCIEYLYLLHNGAGVEKLCSWDCGWFKSIVSGGYDIEPHGHIKQDAANWGFFPLFPLSAKILFSFAGVSLDMALIATGKLFFLTAIFSFILFAKAWSPQCSPWIAGAVVAFSPYSIYGNAGYSESLFLTLTCLSLYFLKKDRYVLSGILGGFCSGTRIVGGAVGFSYLVRIIRRWPHLRDKITVLFALCLIPAGLAAYMLYLHFHMGDALAFAHVHVAWNNVLGNPLIRLAQVFKWSILPVSTGISILVAFLAMVQFARSGNYELLLYTLAATLLPLSAGAAAMPRYIWWQAPVLFAVATVITRKRWCLTVYLAASLVFSYFIYAAWIQGGNWVV
jgi:hypothetical protein